MDLQQADKDPVKAEKCVACGIKIWALIYPLSNT